MIDTICIDVGRIIRRPQVGGESAYSHCDRDHADAPPTKVTLLGSGSAPSDLKVRVRMTPANTLLPLEPGYPAEERTIT